MQATIFLADAEPYQEKEVLRDAQLKEVPLSGLLYEKAKRLRLRSALGFRLVS